jgi:hypothetical protein
LLSWALWFGGMISLVLFVMRLFQTDRNLAVLAAPVLFTTFAIYQIIVGLIACASGTLLAWVNTSKIQALLSLLMIAALGLATVIRAWTFEMITLDRGDAAQMNRFQFLHHGTTALYEIATCLLLVAGVGWMITLILQRRRVGGTEPGTGSLAEAAGRSQVA